MKKETLAFLMTIIIYSFAAMAYMHKTFVDKDFIQLISSQLERIEKKVDLCHKRSNQ